MLECETCEGNGVIVVGSFGEDHIMVQVCNVCDGEGEILWASKACIPVGEGGCCG